MPSRNKRVKEARARKSPAAGASRGMAASVPTDVVPVGKGSGSAGGEPRAQPHDGGGKPVRSLPVVGIGASAGGLEAFTQLLSQLPTDTGMAFVLVQHL